MPKSTTEVLTRVESNARYFTSNYALVCLLTMTYAVIFKPVLLFLTIFLSGAGYYCFTRDVVQVGSYSLQGRQKTLAFSTVALVGIILFAGSTIFSVLSICLILVTLHAAFHTSVPNAEVRNARTHNCRTKDHACLMFSFMFPSYASPRPWTNLFSCS